MDVSPPQLQGAQPLLAVLSQPPQKPPGALPHLAPAAEPSRLRQALRANKSDTLLRIIGHLLNNQFINQHIGTDV